MTASLSVYIQTFLLAMAPISEIRGSIIWGLANVSQNFTNILIIYVISVVGNFLPVPFIMFLIRPVIKWLKRTKLFGKLARWVERRTNRKANDMAKKQAKVGAFALFIFVAIPFPTTGAWTGAMIADLLDMRVKYAFPAILGGIMLSGLIMVFLTTGILNLGAFGTFLGA
ncbi:MAG: small multi-drug export protein [Oscillospiraceae bacterium]